MMLTTLLNACAHLRSYIDRLDACIEKQAPDSGACWTDPRDCTTSDCGRHTKTLERDRVAATLASLEAQLEAWGHRLEVM